MKNVLKSLGLAILYFIAFFFIQCIVIAVYSAIITTQLISQETANMDYAALIPQVLNIVIENSAVITLVADFAAFLILLIVYLAGKGKLAAQIGLRKLEVKALALPAFLGITLSIAVTLILGMLPIPETLIEQYTTASDALFGSSVLLQILTIGIVAPVVEELIFRGLIFSRLRLGMPTIVAAIISSIIFGLAHGALVWMAYAFCVGLVLCFVCIKYRSLLAAMVVHIVFNLFGVVINFAASEAAFSNLVGIIIMIIALAASTFIIVKIGKIKTPVEAVATPEEISETEVESKGFEV